MSTLHGYKKNITKSTLRFPAEMYSTLVGSLVVCAYMFSANKPTISSIKKTWKRLLKNSDCLPLMQDTDFIDKTLKIFGMEKPDTFPIALVLSNINGLFAPYVDGNLLPLRDDGLYSQTLQTGKIYPIDFNGNIEGVTDGMVTECNESDKS